MNDIVRLWPYVSLAARWEDDRIFDNKDKSDFIDTTIREWHPGETHHVEIFHLPIRNTKRNIVGYDTTYLAEVGSGNYREIIISSLGTDNKSGWFSNIFGTLFGLFKPFRGMNPAFGRVAWTMYEAISGWFDCHPHAKKLSIKNIAHSRGGRAVGMSLFLSQIKQILCSNYMYCIPPIFTKKGFTLCEKYGVHIRTLNIFQPGDIVDNTGFFRFKHCGKKLELKKDPEWFMSNLPIVSHAYSAITHNLMWTYSDTESIEYLRKRSFVDEI